MTLTRCAMPSGAVSKAGNLIVTFGNVTGCLSHTAAWEAAGGITIRAVGYVLLFPAGAAMFAALTVSYHRRHRLHWTAVAAGFICPPVLLGGLLVAVPAPLGPSAHGSPAAVAYCDGLPGPLRPARVLTRPFLRGGAALARWQTGSVAEPASGSHSAALAAEPLCGTVARFRHVSPGRSPLKPRLTATVIRGRTVKSSS